MKPMFVCRAVKEIGPTGAISYPPVAGIMIADFYIVRRGFAVATNVAENVAFKPLAIIAGWQA